MCRGSPSWIRLPGTVTKCNSTLQYLPLKAEPLRPKQNDWIWLSDISSAGSQNRILPKNFKKHAPQPKRNPAERAVCIEDELLAVEQEAAEELMRKQEALRRAWPRGRWRRWHRGCVRGGQASGAGRE